MWPRSIAGVPFDSVRRFRASLFLHTTCSISVGIGLLAVWRYNKPKTKNHPSDICDMTDVNVNHLHVIDVTMWHDSFICDMSHCDARDVCDMIVCERELFACVKPQMEEIRLKIISTAQISNKFSQEYPYTSNRFSRESPKFRTGYHLSKRSPCHSK